MIYRAPGFLAVVLFGSSPTPFLHLSNNLPLFLCLPVCRRSSLLTGRGVGDGRGAKSYDREKATLAVSDVRKSIN
jgi:hypothetical protein